MSARCRQAPPATACGYFPNKGLGSSLRAEKRWIAALEVCRRTLLQIGRARVADLKSGHHPQQGVRGLQIDKRHWNQILASALLHPKFVPEGAAIYRELRNRSTRGGHVGLRTGFWDVEYDIWQHRQ